MGEAPFPPQHGSWARSVSVRVAAGGTHLAWVLHWGPATGETLFSPDLQTFPRKVQGKGRQRPRETRPLTHSGGVEAEPGGRRAGFRAQQVSTCCHSTSSRI